MAEAFFKKEASKTLIEELATCIAKLRDTSTKHKLSAALDAVKSQVTQAIKNGIEFHAKKLLKDLGTLTAATYYYEWAESTGEEWAIALAKIYTTTELEGRDYEYSLAKKAEEGLGWLMA